MMAYGKYNANDKNDGERYERVEATEQCKVRREEIEGE